MSIARLSPELQRLLDELLEGDISAADHERLQGMLKSDPQVQETYFAYLDLQIGLRKLASMQPPAAAAVPLEHPAAAVLPSVSTRGDNVRRARRLFWASSAMLLATIMLVAAVWWGVPGLEPAHLADEVPALEDWPVGPQLIPVKGPEAPVVVPTGSVRLVQAASAEFFFQMLPPVGHALELQKEYALTHGMIELGFPDGAHAILEAPAVFEIVSTDRLQLRIGRCSVHAPEGAEGFRVETPVSQIVDLGTRFSVRVNEVGETDVQVVEGAAEVHHADRAQATAPRRLNEQQALRIGGQQGSSEQAMRFRPELYRGRLPDRVVSYEAASSDGRNVDALRSITVQRGNEMRTYPVEDLIAVDLLHFRATENRFNVIVSPNDRRVDRAFTLTDDDLLNTGVLNPGGAAEPLMTDPVLGDDMIPAEETTPGMAVRFERPVINGPGPDVVLFEINSVVDAPNGDAFHVSPLRFAPGLRSHTIRRFDIATGSPESLPVVPFVQYRFEHPPGSLRELLTAPGESRDATLEFRALAVGIDLSDLGYPPGSEVEGLFLQDAFDDLHYVDPVFIAGLPEEQPKGLSE